MVAMPCVEEDETGIATEEVRSVGVVAVVVVVVFVDVLSVGCVGVTVVGVAVVKEVGEGDDEE